MDKKILTAKEARAETDKVVSNKDVREVRDIMLLISNAIIVGKDKIVINKDIKPITFDKLKDLGYNCKKTTGKSEVIISW